MEVIINGVLYVPASPMPCAPSVLDTRRRTQDFDHEVTLREYLQSLLLTLLREGEGFSAKRPFGNSGWEWDVAAFLVQAGAVTGVWDVDGGLDDFDRVAASAALPGVIAAAFAPPAQ